MTFRHHVAKTGGRFVSMSPLVESHAKMLGRLSSLEFFRPGMIPERIDYVCGYASLRKDGLSGLPDLIRDTLYL